MAQKHVCGSCDKEFTSESGYLSHQCAESGERPTKIAHLEATTTPNFSTISEASLARGEERVGEKTHPAKAAAKGGK